jgi:hypothetical protein
MEIEDRQIIIRRQPNNANEQQNLMWIMADFSTTAKLCAKAEEIWMHAHGQKTAHRIIPAAKR